MTLPAEVEADIRALFPPSEWEAVRTTALAMLDPKRCERLHKPILATLAGVIDAHIKMSQRNGEELLPADITDVLATLLASHVASTANPRMQAADITLEIGKLVSSRLHRMLTNPQFRKPS